jgi:hypothetical protein
MLQRDGTPAGPTVNITPGYALIPDGDEIFVPRSEVFTIDCIENLAGDCTDLGEATPADKILYLVLRCHSPPVPCRFSLNTVIPKRSVMMHAGKKVMNLPAWTSFPAYQAEADCAAVLIIFCRQIVPAAQTSLAEQRCSWLV